MKSSLRSAVVGSWSCEVVRFERGFRTSPLTTSPPTTLPGGQPSC